MCRRSAAIPAAIDGVTHQNDSHKQTSHYMDRIESCRNAIIKKSKKKKRRYCHTSTPSQPFIDENRWDSLIFFFCFSLFPRLEYRQFDRKDKRRIEWLMRCSEGAHFAIYSRVRDLFKRKSWSKSVYLFFRYIYIDLYAVKVERTISFSVWCSYLLWSQPSIKPFKIPLELSAFVLFFSLSQAFVCTAIALRANTTKWQRRQQHQRLTSSQ